MKNKKPEETALEFYKQAQEMLRHQDRVRFILLNFCILLFLGVFTTIDKLKRNEKILGGLLITTSVVGLFLLYLVFREHVFMLKYKKWRNIIEKYLTQSSDKQNKNDLSKIGWNYVIRNYEVYIDYKSDITWFVAILLLLSSATMFIGLTRFGVCNLIAVIISGILFVLITSIYFIIIKRRYREKSENTSI